MGSLLSRTDFYRQRTKDKRQLKPGVQADQYCYQHHAAKLHARLGYVVSHNRRCRIACGHKFRNGL